MGSCRIIRTAALAALAAALPLTFAPAGASAQPTPVEIEQQLVTAGHELEIIVEQYNAVREDLAGTTAELGTLAARAQPLAASVGAAEASVAEIAAQAYRGASIASVTALITADSPDTLMDQLTVLEHLRSLRVAEVTALVDARDRYAGEQRALTDLAHRQQAQAAELGTRRAAIEERIRQLEQLRAQAARVRPGSRRAAPRDGYVPALRPDRAGSAVRYAYAQLDKPYRYGAEGPEAYDCSGLTMAAWRAAGVRLPHSAARQFSAVRRISRADLRPGDLVFYYRDIHHVALYVGDGRVIDAPQTGERITMRSMDYGPITGYGRPA